MILNLSAEEALTVITDLDLLDRDPALENVTIQRAEQQIIEIVRSKVQQQIMKEVV